MEPRSWARDLRTQMLYWKAKKCFKIDSNTRSFLWTRIVRFHRFEKSISKSASDLILIFEDFGFCFFWILQSPSRFPRLPSSRISKVVDFRVPRVNHLESEYIFTLMSFYGLGKQNNLDVINVTFFVMIQLPSSGEFIASKFKNVVFRWQVTESGIVSLIFLRLRNLAHHFIIQKKRNPSKCLNNNLEVPWFRGWLRKRIEFLGIWNDHYLMLYHEKV